MIVNLTVRSQTVSLQVAALNTGGPGGASDHGALSGLADDDHPQYLNAARGDARYDAIGAASAAVGAHAGATDPHGDRAFATAAVGTHAAAAGAHPISGVDGLAAALALLAPLLSPALTGTPTAPTAAPGTASTQIASTAFVAAAIATLLNSAPGALDTLDELAAALGDDPNFATTVTNALAGKLAKASNLADLVDAAAARTNLGATTIGGQVFTAADAAAIRSLLTLGAAALLNIGTTAGTAAAGDDSRIVGAVQTARNVSTQHSLTGGGDLSADRTLALVGDTASPGNSKVYGTDASGVRGWYDAASGGASPGGSGSELQYRGGASTFSGAAGTHWDAANGRLSIGAGTSPAGMLHAQSSAASVCAGVLQGAASQTANIFDARNSAGSTLAGITSSGIFRCAGISCQSTSSDALITYSTYGFLLSRFGYGAFIGTESTYGGIVTLRSDGAVGFASSTSLPASPDTRLTRVAAGILGVRANSGTAGAAIGLVEQTAPSAPSANGVYIYAEDDGAGKTRLMALFASGAAQQIAIEP